MISENTTQELLNLLFKKNNIIKPEDCNSVEKFVESEYFRKFVIMPNFKEYGKTKSDINHRKPSFKELQREDILLLRYSIYNNVNKINVHDWLEALLRFCEIRYSSLKKYSMNKWSDKQLMNYNMLQLTVLLMDYYYYSKDMRFLNTALKLRDLKWMMKINLLRRKLNAVNIDYSNALLQLQIILLTENEIRKYYKTVK